VADPTGAPSIFVGLQEELGLKLEAGRGPVDTLVIDHIERPAQNKHFEQPPRIFNRRISSLNPGFNNRIFAF
jgi:hypothetical protein